MKRENGAVLNTGWLVGWLAGGLAGWLAGWLVGWLQVEEDLKKKKVSELKKDAKALGVSEAAISDADDTSSPKTRLLTSS